MHNRIIYQTGGFVFLMSHWVLDGCKQSPDEMARLLDSYIHNEKNNRNSVSDCLRFPAAGSFFYLQPFSAEVT